jgi:hypothetical protein
MTLVVVKSKRFFWRMFSELVSLTLIVLLCHTRVAKAFLSLP